MISQGKIFRQSTLDRLSSPEQLDQLMQITQPRSWLMLLGLLVSLAAAVAWGVLGTVPIEITGPAMFVKSGGINQIPTLHTGQIASLAVQATDAVTAGQIIGTVQTGAGIQPVTAPVDGQIVTVQVSSGSLVGAGDVIATLEQTGPEVEQEAILYLSTREGARIQPGMKAQIVPDVLPETTVGGLIGEVVAVSPSPVTAAQALRMIGDPQAFSMLGFEPGQVEVRVRLLQTGDGHFLWSNGVQPTIQPTSGSFARTRIILGEQAPIWFMLPGQPPQTP